jgi:hypothetical protein
MTRRSDADALQLIARYRERYSDGPFGKWHSRLDSRIGSGFDATELFGSRIEFRADGSGVCENWGTFSGEPKTAFRWSSAGPCRVLIWVEEDDEAPEEVAYDFHILEGSNEVLMVQVGLSHEGNWFWHFPSPFAWIDEASE